MNIQLRIVSNERTRRKRAATLCYVGHHEFRPVAITRVPGYPVVYWWDRALFDLFESGATTVKKSLRVRQGLATGDDTRFLLRPWEVASRRVLQTAPKVSLRQLALAPHLSWCPYIKGAAGKRWFEPLDHVIRWERNGLHKKLFFDFYGSKGGNGAPSEGDYFQGGLVFSTIGSDFGGRFQRFASIFASTGCTVFGDDLDSVCTLFNSMLARRILASFNPTVHFTNNDVERLPIVHIEDSEQIVEALRDSFGRHESHREPSVEFLQPGPSSWCHIQAWAQAAVDRPEGIRLPAYQPEYDAEPPTDHLSYALGVALGRFGPNGEGILDPANDDLSHGLPAGILFLDGTLDANDLRDGLGHASAEPLLASWAEHGATIAAGADLRSYLRTKFFSDVHCSMYENRPIHWPLSSEKKTFVAWATIHRWTAETLHVVLADHLYPSLARLEGELADLQAARLGSDKRAAGAAERRFEKVQKWRDELLKFIAAVEQCAEKGPPPADTKCPARDFDARYVPDLDDGVMINSAALWPLLIPQWKAPKNWWKELARAQGKKDYDWAHLAMRYWPTRADEKCREDPSFGVAHGCFWKYHPARAWAWELRLQDEIGQDFRIEEAPYGGDADDHEAHRTNYLRDHTSEALHAVEREAVRRRRKLKRPLKELRLIESGLWLTIPEECWDLELRMSEKQGEEFHLLAPDEPAARVAFEQAHPDLLFAREQLLASLTPPADLFDQDDGEDEGEPDEDVELTEDDVPEAVNG